MRQKLVAAEQSAAQAIRGNTLRERAAAQQLQDAHQELAAAREVRDKFSNFQHQQLHACPHVHACLAGSCLWVLRTDNLLGKGHSTDWRYVACSGDRAPESCQGGC